jgi:hypothetical protein
MSTVLALASGTANLILEGYAILPNFAYTLDIHCKKNWS